VEHDLRLLPRPAHPAARAGRAGAIFAGADVQESKQIFATAARTVPLIATITNALGRSGDGALRAGFFRDLLAHHYTSEQVTRQLETATDWGRYAELYSYDSLQQEYRIDPALVGDRGDLS
jgi:NitT/TauT family transport system ATP-binding protein